MAITSNWRKIRTYSVLNLKNPFLFEIGKDWLDLGHCIKRNNKNYLAILVPNHFRPLLSSAGFRGHGINNTCKIQSTLMLNMFGSVTKDLYVRCWKISIQTFQYLGLANKIVFSNQTRLLLQNEHDCLI